MTSRCLVLVFWAACLPLLGGCFGSKPTSPAPVAVTGHVVSATGKPIVNMLISFHLQEGAQAGNGRSDVLDKQGAFKVEIIPGRYKVTLAPIPMHHGATDGTGELAAPPSKGADPKKASKDKGVPQNYSDAKSSPWDVTIPPEGKDLNLTVN